MAHPNADLIEGAYASFAQGDIAAIMEIWTDDITWHLAGENPLAGDHHGKQAVAEFLGGFAQMAGETLKVDLQNVLADDTQGYSLHTTTATKGGVEIESWEILSYEFRDGKVSEIWSFAYDQRLAESVLA